MTRILVAFSFGIALLWAQAEAPMVLLNRAREQVRDDSRDIPRYTCLQQTDRQQLVMPKGVRPDGCFKGKRDLSEEDRIRLEMAVAEDHEMFAWPGQSTFDLNAPAQFGVGGAMATGMFGMLLRGAMVSEADPAAYRFIRNLTDNGHDLAEFEFHVPRATSNYTLADQYSRAMVGYQGTVLIDRKTADVYRLKVTLDVPSTFMDMCAVDLSLEYQREKIQSTEPLLVKSADLDVVHATGDEERNHSVYSGCHMFTTESSIKFDSVDDRSSPNGPASVGALTPVAAPAKGLKFQMALTTPIDSRKQAVGDRVEAVLTGDLKDDHGRVIAAKGSRVQARIVWLQHFVLHDTVLFGLRPERLIRRDGTVSPIRASLAKMPKDAIFTLPPKGTPPGSGYFTYEKRKYLALPAGWATNWWTIDQ